MHPRLYMQSFQYATYNSNSGKVTFDTRHIRGRRFHFDLTKNQMFALDDAISLIDQGEAWGHFPLGYNTWLHYGRSGVSLYKESENRRIYFHFSSFKEYKTATHRRLLSLIRLKDQTVVTGRARRSNNGRHQRGRGEAQIKSTSNKRPLSSEFQSSHRSSSPKRNRGGEWKAASRATNNAIMSHDVEESSVFSKWNGSNIGRRTDSISSLSSASKSVLSPEEVCLESGNTLDIMESE